MAGVANAKIIIETEVSRAVRGLGKTEKGLKDNAIAAKVAAQALRQMNIAATRARGVQQITGQLRNASAAFGQLATSHQKVAFLSNPAAQAQAFGTMVTGMNSMGRAAAANAIKLGVLSKSMAFLRTGIGKLGLAFGGVAVAGGIARFGVNSVKAFADVEAAMAPVLTLADFTTEQIEAMEASTTKLRREFGATAQEIGKARFDVISSGFQEVNEQTRILTGSMQLAKTTGAEFSTATETLTSTLAAFNFDASVTELVMDKLKAGGDIAKGTFDALGPAIAQVAPAAVETGKSLDEVIAGLSLLTLAGIEESRAASLLSSSFIQLIKPETLRRLDAAGIALDANTIKTKGLIGVIEELPTEDAAKLFEILGRQEAFRGISVLARNMDELKVKIKEVGNANGLVQAEIAEALSNTDVKLKKLGQSWDILSENIGKTLVGNNEKFDKLSKVLDVIADNTDTIKDAFLVLAAFMRGDLLSAAQRVGKIISDIFKGTPSEGKAALEQIVKQRKEAEATVALLQKQGATNVRTQSRIAAKTAEVIELRRQELRIQKELNAEKAVTPKGVVGDDDADGLAGRLTAAQEQANIRLLALRGEDLAAFKANLDVELDAAREQGVALTTLARIRKLEIDKFTNDAAQERLKSSQDLSVSILKLQGKGLLAEIKQAQFASREKQRNANNNKNLLIQIEQERVATIQGILVKAQEAATKNVEVANKANEAARQAQLTAVSTGSVVAATAAKVANQAAVDAVTKAEEAVRLLKEAIAAAEAAGVDVSSVETPIPPQVIDSDEVTRLDALKVKVAELGGALQQAFSGAVANSITKVFEEIGKGGKVNMKAFVGSILSALGSALIAWGTFALITGGIRALTGDPGGALLIAAGAAAIVIGAGMTAAGAAISKSAQKGQGQSAGEAASGAGEFGRTGGPEGRAPGRAGGNITLNIQGVLSMSDLADTLENDIMPIMEEITGRGASKFVINET